MPTLKGRLGEWHLDDLHAWSDRDLLIRAPADPIIGPTTKVATIGSCFASELASMMGKVGIVGGMHPDGLFYSTATIRQELERVAGGWPERAAEASWSVDGGRVDPFRDYGLAHPDEPTLRAARADADADADALPDEITAWCRGRLSGYKRPRHVVVLDTLGRSAAGKADYRRLREVAQERVAG